MSFECVLDYLLAFGNFKTVVKKCPSRAIASFIVRYKIWCKGSC